MLAAARIAVISLGVADVGGVTAQARAEPPIDFARQIRPIFEASCVDCHGPMRRRANLRLDIAATALKGGKSGPAIVPGKPDESLLFRRVLGQDDMEQMPQDADPLSAEQVELLRRWIQEGAHWPEQPGARGAAADHNHWAYVKPVGSRSPSEAKINELGEGRSLYMTMLLGAR